MPWIAAGGAIVGGLFGSSGAKSAAKAQAAATREATELQRKQFEQTRSDLTPYRSLGTSGVNKLAMLLGLDVPAEVSAADRNAIRQRLLPQYTTNTEAGPGRWEWEGTGDSGQQVWVQTPATSAVDEAALNAAIDREIADMTRRSAANRPAGFGSLLENFTGEDLENDPGYAFARDQGQKALDNRLASAGSYFSGAALKAASRYNNDFASTKFNEAYQRDAGNKQRAYNFLSGAVGTGQNSAAMTAQAGANMANQVGSNITAMGSAMGASQIASNNALASGLSGGAAAYQRGNWLNQQAAQQGEQNALLRTILGGNTGWGGGESWRNTGSGMPDWYQPS